MATSLPLGGSRGWPGSGSSPAGPANRAAPAATAGCFLLPGGLGAGAGSRGGPGSLSLPWAPAAPRPGPARRSTLWRHPAAGLGSWAPASLSSVATPATHSAWAGKRHKSTTACLQELHLCLQAPIGPLSVCSDSFPSTALKQKLTTSPPGKPPWPCAAPLAKEH